MTREIDVKWRVRIDYWFESIENITVPRNRTAIRSKVFFFLWETLTEHSHQLPLPPLFIIVIITVFFFVIIIIIIMIIHEIFCVMCNFFTKYLHSGFSKCLQYLDELSVFPIDTTHRIWDTFANSDNNTTYDQILT